MPVSILKTPWTLGSQKVSKYSPLDRQRFLPFQEDAEKKTSSEGSEDSDETLVKEALEYQVKSNRVRVIVWLVVALLGGALVGFGASWLFLDKRPMSPKSPVKEFAPEMPLATVVFEEIPELYGPPSRETDEYWDSLVPPGKGFVQIPNPQDYDLKPGILTQTSVERYSVTMYHELHCLALIRRYYWHLVDAVSNGWHEDAKQEMVREQLYNHHPHHCFAYIAQGIMCNADLTIEWARVEPDGRRFQVEGWGIPHHTCKDPKAVRDWAMKHHSPARPNSTHIDGSHG